MTPLTSIAPQFICVDLAQSLNYYTSVLGFVQRIAYENYYASVARDAAEIHLKLGAPLAAQRRFVQDNAHLDAYITVDDVADVYAELQNSGAAIHAELCVQPWGIKDFYVSDPDGYILCFAEMDRTE